MDDEGQAPGADEDWLQRSVGGGRAAPVAEAHDDAWDAASTHLRVLGESSTNPAICPFLRADLVDGLGPPVEAPDPRNRCTAIGRPTPQSGRQQEIVCLTRGHSNCPRYLRGAHVLTEPATNVHSGPSVAVLGAAVALAIAATLSVGFLLVRGGFDLALASPSPTLLAVVQESPGPTTISLDATSTPVQTPSPTPGPTDTPTSPPPPTSPTVTPVPTATPTSAPTPTSDRYALLQRCPSTPNCWIYTVRSGDNLESIVNWFGVPYATVVGMNPQLPDPTHIHAGDKIRMPPPTR